MEAQRGFTLVEVVVAVAILALLSGAVVGMSLAQRPGALRAATSGYDASLAAARALAATSGNGATLAFAPRTDGRGNALPGFALTVFRGRPNADGAVTPSTVPPLLSDADVREATLGKPPFAIFLSSAGDPSGVAAYPQFDARGIATFATLAAQPPCPSGGFVFTFSGAHAAQTRALTCGIAAIGTPIPLVTMTPSPIVLTPSSLVYDWPAAARASFVATEWGYTRWYTAPSFTCGAAAFPQSNPEPPYSQPHSENDESAAPLAPSNVPLSYANAPDSMEDAPARFYVDPVTAGLCNVAISDANRRSATLKVQVMGQLTAVPATLVWTSAADRTQRSSMFGKTYDAQALKLSIVSNTCAGVVDLLWGSSSYPSLPNVGPAQQWLDLTPVTGPDGANVGGTCAISVASQYVGEPPAALTINVPGVMHTWPVAVQYAVSGQQLGNGCTATAYEDTAFTRIDADNTAFASLGVTTDSNGCYNGSLVAYEPSGQTATFGVTNGCGGGSVAVGRWTPGQTGPHAALMVAGGYTANSGCTITLSDGSGLPEGFGVGLVAVQVIESGYDISEQVSNDGCSTRNVGHGNYLISCRGIADVSYRANCFASGALRTSQLSGNGGDSGEPIYAIGPLTVHVNGSPPSVTTTWTAVLTNAWQKLLAREQDESPQATGVMNVTTSGCPP